MHGGLPAGKQIHDEEKNEPTTTDIFLQLLLLEEGRRQALQEVLQRKASLSQATAAPHPSPPPEALPAGQDGAVEDSSTDDPDPVCAGLR